MTTREKIRKVQARLHIALFSFMGAGFLGIYIQSPSLSMAGLIAAIASSWIFAAQMKCPTCRSPIHPDRRNEVKFNYCPGCARSIDEEEPAR